MHIRTLIENFRDIPTLILCPLNEVRAGFLGLGTLAPSGVLTGLALGGAVALSGWLIYGHLRGSRPLEGGFPFGPAPSPYSAATWAYLFGVGALVAMALSQLGAGPTLRLSWVGVVALVAYRGAPVAPAPAPEPAVRPDLWALLALIGALVVGVYVTAALDVRGAVEIALALVGLAA